MILLVAALSFLCGATFCHNVYTIESAEEFIQFSKSVATGTAYNGTTIYLSSDIDLSGNLSSEFEPIGKNKDNTFIGTFDGLGHTISNLVITTSSLMSGIFGYSTGAIVRNVVVDSSCSFTVSNVVGNGCSGTFFGYCVTKNATCAVENSITMATLTYDLASTNSYIGGIAGRMYSFNENKVTIKNCANYGSITVDNVKSAVYVGGVVADFTQYLSDNIHVQNAANYGTIMVSNVEKYMYVGGIFGLSKRSLAENCVSAGRLVLIKGNATICAGSLVGYNDDSMEFRNSFWTNSVGYTNASGKVKPVLTDSSLVSINKTILNKLNNYAVDNGWNRWLLNEKSAQITFVVNNGKSFAVSERLVMFPDFEVQSVFSFNGWYTDALLSDKCTSTEIANDTTLYGLCGLVISVGFKGMGGTTSKSVKSVTYGNPYGEFPAVERAGNKFIWWYVIENSSKVIVTEETKVAYPNYHYVYAAWETNTVTFERGDGTVVDSYTVKYNEAITYPKNPKRGGYKFVGWDKNIVTTEGVDVVITALWEEKGNTAGIVIGVLVAILFVAIVCVVGFIFYKKKYQNNGYSEVSQA